MPIDKIEVLLSSTINARGSVINLSFSNMAFIDVDALVLAHRCSELNYHVTRLVFDEYEISISISFN